MLRALLAFYFVIITSDRFTWIESEAFETLEECQRVQALPIQY